MLENPGLRNNSLRFTGVHPPKWGRDGAARGEKLD